MHQWAKQTKFLALLELTGSRRRQKIIDKCHKLYNKSEGDTCHGKKRKGRPGLQERKMKIKL